MKKKYESPVMFAQVFSADQTVAGNCVPGVDEAKVSPMSVDCASGSSIWTAILAWLGFDVHDHGWGLTEDSKQCIATKSTTIFADSCDNKVGEGDLRDYNGTSYIACSWDSNSPRLNHTALINNGSANRPNYWNS